MVCCLQKKKAVSSDDDDDFDMAPTAEVAHRGRTTGRAKPAVKYNFDEDEDDDSDF